MILQWDPIINGIDLYVFGKILRSKTPKKKIKIKNRTIPYINFKQTLLFSQEDPSLLNTFLGQYSESPKQYSGKSHS